MVSVKSETLDGLLLSRALIAPLRFRPANDRFTVARHVLAAHDAAELAIAGICAERGIPIPDNRALGLPDYLGKLKEHLHPGKEVPAKDYITKLNRVRVDLKHHGITPDANQWRSVAEIVFGHISTWCETYLKIDYAELDAADLINSPAVRNSVLDARNHLRGGRFKECLEKLAEAIDQASSHLFPIGIHVSAGYANAETALTLAAYGVDPGRYIALQRLLPRKSSLFGSHLSWDARQYGHEANWKRANGEFAYSETVNLLTRLQEAKPYPTPYLYTDVYKDVLIVKKDAPSVIVLRWSFPDEWQVTDEQPQFSAGDRIECRAVGSMLEAPNIPDPEQSTRPPEESLQVLAKDIQNCGKLKDEGVFAVIIFQREDVEITKEPFDWIDEMEGKGNPRGIRIELDEE